MTTIHVIRHAQASFGKNDYDRLSPLGARQALLLADHLESLGIDFHCFYLGEHQRHAQTFEPYENRLIKAGKTFRAQKQAALNEFDYESVLRTAVPQLIKHDPTLARDVDGMLDDNLVFQRIFEKSVYMWLEKPERFPGLESWQDFSRQAATVIDSIMEETGPGQNPVIVTSGGVVAAMVQAALDLSDKMTLGLSWQIYNGSITRFKYRDRKPVLSGFNDIAYINASPDKSLATYR